MYILGFPKEGSMNKATHFYILGFVNVKDSLGTSRWLANVIAITSI